MAARNKKALVGFGGLDQGGNGSDSTAELSTPHYSTKPADVQPLTRQDFIKRMDQADAAGDQAAWVEAFLSWLELVCEGVRQ